MKGHEPILVAESLPEIARQAGFLKLGEKFRRDVGGDRDAAVAAVRHECQGRRVFARQLVEVRTHGVTLLADPIELGGGVLDANDVLQLE